MHFLGFPSVYMQSFMVWELWRARTHAHGKIEITQRDKKQLRTSDLLVPGIPVQSKHLGRGKERRN